MILFFYWNCQFYKKAGAIKPPSNGSPTPKTQLKKSLLSILRIANWASYLTMCFSAGLAVSNKRTHLLLSMRYTGPSEGSVWITWRLPVLPERRRRLFDLDFPDHREGVLQSVCVWWLCGGPQGDSGGSGLHRRHSVDPGWRRRRKAGLVHSSRGAVFIPGAAWTLPRSRVPQWLCVLFKTDCQRRHINSFLHTFL